MAPRKEKTEKVSADEAVDTILNYLRKQNRPYSASKDGTDCEEATDISANLHNKVTKAAAAKILKDLHERQQIAGCAAGKQIVYHTLQSADDAPTPESLSALSTRIQDLRNDTATQQATLKTLRAQLSTLSASLTTTELTSTVSSLTQQRAGLLARLGPLRTGDVKPVSQEDMKEVEAQLRTWEGLKIKRAKIEREMWGMMRDAIPEGVGVAELREKLGLDE